MKYRLCLIAAALALAGCAQQEMGDLHKFISDVKARPPTAIEPIPQIKQAETFLYVANDRRDPFAAFMEAESPTEVATVGGLTPDFNRRKEELEAYPLDSLSMVGTLEQSSDYWALVKTKEGTIHRVKPGNYLGQNHGRILAISEDRIDLQELVQDSKGGYLEHNAALALGERNEEKR